MRRCGWAITILIGLVTVQALGGEDDWTHLGRDASRQSIAADGPNTLDANTPGWVVKTDPQNSSHDIAVEGATGPVVYAGKVFAYAGCGQDPNSQVAAWDAASGRLLWSTRIDKASWGSWSTPCVDTKHNSVLIGSGSRIFALDANDGSPVWKVPIELEGPVINASICTALDLPHARAFLTDASKDGHLYCINLDANEPNNPHEPGHILWGYQIGSTLGNSPSYADGVVYVAAGGTIYAFDANAASEPNKPIWKAPKDNWVAVDPNIPVRGQFWGGVTATQEGFLYAATYKYDTTTGENNSTLVKLDRRDGRIIWTFDVERTDTIPVVVGDMIFVSGGLSGPFGSKPKLQAFHDLGDRAKLDWDTSVALPDEAIGGWTAQPCYASGKLYVGGITSVGDYFGAYDTLYILDVSCRPEDPGFVIHEAQEGCGNSPVVTHDSVYSIGPNALTRFYQPCTLPGIIGDGPVNASEMVGQGVRTSH